MSRIDTVQAKDCYDPTDFILVHKDYLAALTRDKAAAWRENRRLRARVAELENAGPVPSGASQDGGTSNG